MKELYFIRHGTALHNILFWEMGNNAYTKYRDTPLMHEGLMEANKLNETWEELDNIELIIVSPLFRTLQTARGIFNNTNVFKTNCIANDLIIEYPLGDNEICNFRKNKSFLKKNFPNVIFSDIKEDFDWPVVKEKQNDLILRLNKFKEFIKTRKETKIAIVTHSCVMNQYMYGNIGTEENDLKKCVHCKPYKILFNEK